MNNRGDIIYWRIIIFLLSTLSLIGLTTELAVSRNILPPNRDSLFELSVIHLNDFHARFVQTNPNSEACEKDFEEKCVGGIARIYTASKRLLNERPNAIFLNAGDNFQGTLWYNIHRWNVTVTFMNMLPPQNAMTLGNHEFDDSIDGIVPFLRTINTKIVVTNIDISDEPKLQGLFTNSTIIERNGTKIGIIGVTTTNVKTRGETRKLKFLDEVESVNAEAERLKNRGINIIIVLSHAGLSTDRIMALNCTNIDLIVGGHSHTFLYSGDPLPSFDIPKDDYPIVVKQHQRDDRIVLIVQAAAFTKYLGNLSVWFDENGETVEWQGNPILLDNSIEQDPEILSALGAWKESVDEFGSMIIGYTNVVLNNDCYLGECNLGNLITDAMVDAYVEKAFRENSTHWTDAAVACTNSGGIHIQSSNKSGNISYGEAMYHQLYENSWDVLELRGYDLIKVLEYSVSESYSTSIFIGKHFLQWSGIKVLFDVGNKIYSRVRSLKIRCQACQMPIYENVQSDKWYRIVVPSILVEGGDGYTIIKNRHRNRQVGPLNTDYYPKYITKITPINIGVEGRITFRGNLRG